MALCVRSNETNPHKPPQLQVKGHCARWQLCYWGWENLPKPGCINDKHDSAAYQQKNFGLCRFLVQCTSRRAILLSQKVQVLFQVLLPYHLTPQGFFYALSLTNIILSGSYLSGMLLERQFPQLLISTRLPISLIPSTASTSSVTSNTVLPCLSSLSSSHLCYHRLSGGVGFCSDWPFSSSFATWF